MGDFLVGASFEDNYSPITHCLYGRAGQSPHRRTAAAKKQNRALQTCRVTAKIHNHRVGAKMRRSLTPSPSHRRLSKPCQFRFKNVWNPAGATTVPADAAPCQSDDISGPKISPLWPASLGGRGSGPWENPVPKTIGFPLVFRWFCGQGLPPRYFWSGNHMAWPQTDRAEGGHGPMLGDAIS